MSKGEEQLRMILYIIIYIKPLSSIHTHMITNKNGGKIKNRLYHKTLYYHLLEYRRLCLQGVYDT